MGGGVVVAESVGEGQRAGAGAGQQRRGGGDLVVGGDVVRGVEPASGLCPVAAGVSVEGGGVERGCDRVGRVATSV